MTKRAEKKATRQAKNAQATADATLRQILIPMVTAMAATKETLTAWVHQMGLQALDEVFGADAERIAGPKGKHLGAARRYQRWGATQVELPFGGRRISVKRPRVRTTDGHEVTLPTVAHFQAADPLAARVVDQVLVGVSTRRYDASLEPPVAGVRSRGASKSAASRHFVARTTAKLTEFLSRPLTELELVALMLDGLELGGHAVVVALGITPDGTKVPLGLWQGSTENAIICTELLQNLIKRGLRIERPILCVIDGGKGIRKALRDVLGDRAVVQRCQLHKRRNVRGHLPKSRQAHVDATMRDAYGSASADTARKRLRALAGWLDSNGHEDAAASVREGLEETLTVVKLGLPATLRRSLASTNAIENVMGTVRHVTRNVKHWRDGAMTRRWAALGVATAQQRFRRIKGHRDLPALVRALQARDTRVDVKEEAA
jgi:transposase-like protein